MNPDQLDLARRLASRPEFKAAAGILPVNSERALDGMRVVIYDLGSETEALPDLTDAATGGVLLDMLGEGWTVITRRGKVDAHPTGCAGPPGVSGATVTEACARALLAEWTTPATPETTAS